MALEPAATWRNRFMAISTRIARIGLAGVLNTKGFDERVIPTGGGYFFSPAIDVLQNKFARST
jgi:hypothetical protein